jgi:hypothetical protein
MHIASSDENGFSFLRPLQLHGLPRLTPTQSASTASPHAVTALYAPSQRRLCHPHTQHPDRHAQPSATNASAAPRNPLTSTPMSSYQRLSPHPHLQIPRPTPQTPDPLKPLRHPRPQCDAPLIPPQRTAPHVNPYSRPHRTQPPDLHKPLTLAMQPPRALSRQPQPRLTPPPHQRHHLAPRRPQPAKSAPLPPPPLDRPARHASPARSALSSIPLQIPALTPTPPSATLDDAAHARAPRKLSPPPRQPLRPLRPRPLLDRTVLPAGLLLAPHALLLRLLRTHLQRLRELLRPRQRLHRRTSFDFHGERDRRGHDQP